MPNNVIIITNCNTEDYDRELLVKSYSVHPEYLNHLHFEHMVLERGYELAEEAFRFADGISSTLELDFMYDKDEEQGYTEYQNTFYIDGHYVIWYEEGGISIRHYYGDAHECWTKPSQLRQL
jgi:hypothetical protein